MWSTMALKIIMLVVYNDKRLWRSCQLLKAESLLGTEWKTGVPQTTFPLQSLLLPPPLLQASSLPLSLFLFLPSPPPPKLQLLFFFNSMEAKRRKQHRDLKEDTSFQKVIYASLIIDSFWHLSTVFKTVIRFMFRFRFGSPFKLCLVPDILAFWVHRYFPMLFRNNSILHELFKMVEGR